MAKNYYAVRVGREPGIYSDFDECQDQVRGYSCCQYRGFNNWSDAEEYLNYDSDDEDDSDQYDSDQYDNDQYDSDQYDNDQYEDSSDEDEDEYYNPNHCNDLEWFPFNERRFRGRFSGERVFTDGCALNNGQHGALAGYGVYWDEDDYRNASLPVRNGEQTNNHAELLALYYVFRQIDQVDDLEGCAYEVYSDSQYACNCITYYSRKWAHNGWITNSNNPVKHQAIIKGINTLINRILQRGAEIKIMYIPAHSGWEGNEQADQLARDGAHKH